MTSLTSKKYKEMLMYAGLVMEAHKDEINALNVFPVPDGDTGSNMNMTLQSGIKAISGKEFGSVDEVAKAFSKGLLMGARGNSGVILSQFFRGVAEGFTDVEDVTTEKMHNAIGSGVKRAYGSVIKAVEGTILTVAREMHENIGDVDADFPTYMEQLVKVANVSLEGTPELLPVLKEVGVVDSGGKGLVVILEGMLANLNGVELDLSVQQNFENFRETEEHPMNPEDITFGYCTEMLIKLHDQDGLDMEVVREILETHGDSIVAIQDEEILKVHVHTESPIDVFNYGLTLGDFVHIKSENMRIQAENANNEVQVKKEQAIVAVASSVEIGQLFNEIQNVELISGGQTMNPSTEDIINAIKKTNAKKVIVLPNNSNIIMAAKAAIDLVEDIEIEVVETKFITQALEALINFSMDNEFFENVEAMKEAIGQTTNIEITRAIKTTSIEGVDITDNDLMAIVNGKIKYSMANESQILKTVIDDLLEADVDVITFLLGENADRSMIDKAEQYISDESPFTEVQIHVTNQPVYSYLISGV